METNALPIMAALKKRLKWLNANQSVVSQNIANADTPGYRAKKLAEQDFSSLVDGLTNTQSRMSATSTLALKTSDARHLSAGGTTQGIASASEDKSVEETPDGNAVVLEEEMLKLADNQMQYGLAINLYRKNAGLLKSAIGQNEG
ncbi:flagellar basal body rod protein FlgB [Kordiimonas sp. SCSIO 12610]|uniref:flagellar basal body rod protein FlgB n=1 Tax=Kordiimonas sp. SCSIO 12610 TaxID=2829597 RepID=UPI00210EB875|nr:flagellar basal body rod protein FlgB [Kordiimonas sp. SCSIO 12610]UTW56815.1 flagellar basal body rod protein FlgB [Kordiimonas sp. SCSIO 12610]